jgi:universal stress protein A
MASYKNILVAVDLSEETQKLLQKVQALVNEDTKVQLVHVGSIFAALFPVSSLGGSSAASDETENLQKEYVNELKTYLKKMAEEAPFPVGQVYVELGKVSTEVSALAKSHNCDLVVIGQHSGKKVERVLGSSANAILHASECDVLTINL